jgi:hypothetical protein
LFGIRFAIAVLLLFVVGIATITFIGGSVFLVFVGTNGTPGPLGQQSWVGSQHLPTAIGVISILAADYARTFNVVGAAVIAIEPARPRAQTILLLKAYRFVQGISFGGVGMFTAFGLK